MDATMRRSGRNALTKEQLVERLDHMLLHIGITNEWVSRRQIANLLGKNRLSPYDVALLGILIHQRRVDAIRLERQGTVNYTWRYRARLSVIN